MDYWDTGIDEDEEVVTETHYKKPKDALLYAIEVSPSMLVKPEGSDRNLVARALKGAYESITNRLIKSPIDTAGVFLYGTEQSTDESTPHVYDVIPLSIPNAESLKRLRELSDEDSKLFQSVCTPVDEDKAGVSLADVFYYANQQYSTKASNFFSRELVIVSDNDNPHTDPKLRKAAKMRAVDLTQLGVRISPILISTPEKPFDTKKFYDELVLMPNTSLLSDEQPLEVLPVSALDMQQHIEAHQVPKRSEFTVQLELAPNVRIGVRGYLPFLRQRIQRQFWIYNKGEKYMLAKDKTVTTLAISGKTVEDKSTIRRTFTFGEEPLPFQPEQIEKLRRVEDPVIRVIGFKLRSSLKYWQNMRHARFIYPYDGELSGSIRAFTSLFKAMVDRDTIAVCWAITRRNSNPRMFALIPSRRRKNEDDDDEMNALEQAYYENFPEGLYMVDLPFCDDLRQTPPAPSCHAPDPLVDTMRGVIENSLMRSGYNPTRYHNSELLGFYKTLRGIALEEEADQEDDKIEDSLMPKFKSINKRAGDSIEQWYKVYEQTLQEQNILRSAGSKRWPDHGDDGSNKQPRVADDVVQLVEQAIADDTLEKCKVADLKQYIEANSIRLPASRVKKELIAAIKSAKK
uniref:ATP-dependent DNA helicase II subunit 1 n=1 Tax=Blastobotrys adeninivorans TaxID=409370 RepID=A0A060TBQ9_BLAAD